MVDFCFYLISDRTILSVENILNFLNSFVSELPPSILAFQLREKDLQGRIFYETAINFKKNLSNLGVKFFINDRIDIAMSINADGVHLGSSGLSHEKVRKIFKGFLGISCHSFKEALLAEKCGADFITFGPIFKTPSKIKYGHPVGVDALKEVCKQISIPIFALGGIDLKNIHLLKGTGIHGISCIRAVLSSNDPATTIMEMLEKSGLIMNEK